MACSRATSCRARDSYAMCACAALPSSNITALCVDLSTCCSYAYPGSASSLFKSIAAPAKLPAFVCFRGTMTPAGRRVRSGKFRRLNTMHVVKVRPLLRRRVRCACVGRSWTRRRRLNASLEVRNAPRDFELEHDATHDVASSTRPRRFVHAYRATQALPKLPTARRHLRSSHSRQIAQQ